MKQLNNAVSIGVVGEVVYDKRSDRTKGFLTEVHNDVFTLRDNLEKAASENKQGSRITVRVLIGRDLDPGLAASTRVSWHSGAVLHAEACVPINHKNLGSMLYFGANTPKRPGSESIAEIGWKHIKKFKDEPMRVRSVDPAEFSLERLQTPTPADTERLKRIFDLAFSSYVTDFTDEVVKQMIENNIVIVARNRQGDICGTSQAELASVEIGGYPWSIAELSDTAVHLEFKGKDIGRLCKARVLAELNGIPNKVVYAEPRANHAAILKLNVQLGLHVGGYLPNHCLIDSKLSDQRQESSYGDLFVFYPQFK
jgi:hypothetical protein